MGPYSTVSQHSYIRSKRLSDTWSEPEIGVGETVDIQAEAAVQWS